MGSRLKALNISIFPKDFNANFDIVNKIFNRALRGISREFLIIRHTLPSKFLKRPDLVFFRKIEPLIFLTQSRDSFKNTISQLQNDGLNFNDFISFLSLKGHVILPKNF